jgi:hypothetical protein
MQDMKQLDPCPASAFGHMLTIVQRLLSDHVAHPGPQTVNLAHKLPAEHEAHGPLPD